MTGRTPWRLPGGLAKWVLGCVVGGWAVIAGAYPGDLEYIPPRDYAAVVAKEMQKAKSSITVCLYLFNLRSQQHDSPVLQLAESLRKAHRSGVRVEVILDQNIPFADMVSGEGISLSQPIAMTDRKNETAVRFLKAQGIPVFLDSAAVYTSNPLYDPQELQNLFDRLKTKYGESPFARAPKAAQMVYEDCAPNAVEALIGLAGIPRLAQDYRRQGPKHNFPTLPEGNAQSAENFRLEIQYGQPRVDAALKLIAQKRPDNPLRSIAYLIATIKNIECRLGRA
ncbi:MAG: hypothetical protein IPN90_01180 [Elusimicrobia bacterium]|nr:hypothetical protein [Elusimicrobiota bacterium]